jgi:hypothetical protein
MFLFAIYGCFVSHCLPQPYADSHRHPHRDTNRYGYAYTDFNTNIHADGNKYGDTDTHCNIYIHSYGNSHVHIYSQRNTYPLQSVCRRACMGETGPRVHLQAR